MTQGPEQRKRSDDLPVDPDYEIDPDYERLAERGKIWREILAYNIKMKPRDMETLVSGFGLLKIAEIISSPNASQELIFNLIGRLIIIDGKAMRGTGVQLGRERLSWKRQHPQAASDPELSRLVEEYYDYIQKIANPDGSLWE